MNEKWFSLTIAEIENKLKTNAASGLSRKAARSAWYRTEHSARKCQPLFIRKKKSIGRMLCEVIADFALIMLMMAALFAVMFDERALGLTVLAICAFCVTVSLAVYYRAQRTMEKLDLYFLPTVKVIRGGKLYRTTFENVVVGDVILLERGDVVCGDARLVTSDNLKVSMRVEKNKYSALRKQAVGVISPDEKDPAKMSNIVHAGSVILDGSARAIVCSVGAFTYLGALTGGIVRTYNDNVPSELKKLKRICSQVNLVSMLCVFPLSIISLLLSKMSGGTATLSSAFLSALAICASSMTQLSCTICKVFFIGKIKDISKSKNASVIRTTDAFDKFAGLDYLFMLDGSAVTDGVLHFDTAFTAEGDMRGFDTPTSTMTALCEMVAVYESAEANTLTVGISIPEQYSRGVTEFLSKSKFDREVIKIKFPIRSYVPGTLSQPTDRVFYTAHGGSMTLDISRTDSVFSLCTHAIVGGQVQPLSRVGADKLRHTYNMHASKGKTVLVFTTAPFNAVGADSARTFVGALVLREGVDKNALNGIAALESNGVKVVSFVNSGTATDAPQIPIEVQRGNRASKEDFLRVGLPIDHKFGDIDVYYGFGERDIEHLVKHAKANGATVGVVGFSDFAQDAIDAADVFISCSSIIDVFSAKSEKELYELELAGAASSLSCTQTVKEAADVLIQRPNGKSGGVSALSAVVSRAKVAHRNLNAFFRYSVCAQLMRIILVCIPMAFGTPILDARHVLLCSFVLDVAVLLIMASDRTPLPTGNHKKHGIVPLKEQLSADRWLVMSLSVSCVLAIVLPMIMGLVGVFGHYLYKLEFLLTPILLLHVLLCYYVRYSTLKAIRTAIKNKAFVGLCAGVVLLLVLVYAVPSFGLYLGVESNTLPYFAASLIAPLVFVIMNEVLAIGSETKRRRQRPIKRI